MIWDGPRLPSLSGIFQICSENDNHEVKSVDNKDNNEQDIKLRWGSKFTLATCDFDGMGWDGMGWDGMGWDWYYPLSAGVATAQKNIKKPTTFSILNLHAVVKPQCHSFWLMSGGSARLEIVRGKKNRTSMFLHHLHHPLPHYPHKGYHWVVRINIFHDDDDDDDDDDCK